MGGREVVCLLGDIQHSTGNNPSLCSQLGGQPGASPKRLFKPLHTMSPTFRSQGSRQDTLPSAS